jgi:hypothetical protein
MGAKPRFLLAIPLIDEYLAGDVKSLFSQRQLENIFREKRGSWKLPKAMLAREFIEKLVEHALLTSISFALPAGSRTFYYRGAINPYRLALSLVPHSYLSHQSALYMHGLLLKAPQRIFVNQEQSAKHASATEALTQTAVDTAFAKPQRQPQNSTTYESYELLFLNGQATGQLGVVELTHPAAGKVKVTSLERTLLDITVRPTYVGGVSNVLRAYQVAAPLVSVKKLEELLIKLNHRYPYHQAVGFYLERVGTYKAVDLRHFEQREKVLDFYLAHNMDEVDYFPKWKVFYPSVLNS